MLPCFIFVLWFVDAVLGVVKGCVLKAILVILERILFASSAPHHTKIQQYFGIQKRFSELWGKT